MWDKGVALWSFSYNPPPPPPVCPDLLLVQEFNNRYVSNDLIRRSFSTIYVFLSCDWSGVFYAFGVSSDGIFKFLRGPGIDSTSLCSLRPYL